MGLDQKMTLDCLDQTAVTGYPIGKVALVNARVETGRIAMVLDMEMQALAYTIPLATRTALNRLFQFL